MQTIEIGYQAFASEGGAELGAVRQILEHELVVYFENAGDFVVPIDAVQDVHAHAIVLDCDKLDPALRDAISHAHDADDDIRA